MITIKSWIKYQRKLTRNVSEKCMQINKHLNTNIKKTWNFYLRTGNSLNYKLKKQWNEVILNEMKRNKHPTWMNFKPLSQSHAEKLTSSFLWSFPPHVFCLLLKKQHFVSFPQPFGNKHESSIKKRYMLHASCNF